MPPTEPTVPPNPYSALIDKEAERAETDLSDFRSRAVTVLTTSSAIVTLMTGLVTFAATKVDAKTFHVPILSILVVEVSLLFFVMALVFALIANAPWDCPFSERRGWEGACGVDHS